jgi:host factor-I protein
MHNQNLQDAFLNSARKECLPVTIYLTSGVKLTGRVRGFDKYCVVFETDHQEPLIFKHAISTVGTSRRPGTSRPGSLMIRNLRKSPLNRMLRTPPTS